MTTLLLTACQSTTPPDWYVSPETNQPDYIQAVGRGLTLYSAKQSALSQINSELWTQVNSSFSMKEVSRTFNNNSNNYNLVDNNINSSTAKITFTGVEYPKQEHNDIGYYVQAKVKKQTIIHQLTTDINNYNEQAKFQLDAFNHQDHLTWWLTNRNIAKYRDDVIVRLAILNALNPATNNIKTPYVKSLLEKVTRVKSSLLIHIAHSSHDKKSAEFLSRSLNEQGIATTMRFSRKATHTLKMTSEFRHSYMASAYISTKVTDLSLSNNTSHYVLATQEIISTGNSLSSYKMANEGSERNFANIITNHGIWASLGLQK